MNDHVSSTWNRARSYDEEKIFGQPAWVCRGGSYAPEVKQI